jgi:prolyl-tRNA synthetase
MRLSSFFIPTLREAPGDAVISSHKLMMRSGMLRKLSNGLFAYLPLGLRSFRKVERIIREEMDAIGALEIKPTVVVPAELWMESGRWETMGAGMLRVKNRLQNDLVVSPTAEEVFTSIVRDELASYRQLPLCLYQINTKYRDEIRPRYGVMRGREFTMKDAYSFHADEKSLEATYGDMAKAYRRIFKRCGLTVIPVRADTGAMGGTGSEEFMVESEVGDNTLILCSCGYAANVEKASCRPDWKEGAPTGKKPERIDTPNVRTIDDLAAFLKSDAKSFIKTLVYKAHSVELDLGGAPGCAGLKKSRTAPDAPETYPEAFFAVCIRGDLDANEAKLAATLKAAEVELAADSDVERVTGAPLGFAGPVGLGSVPVICDESVMGMHDAFTGGLVRDVHLAHVEPGRDFTPWKAADLRAVKAGDACPECGKPVYEKKGNELGHIFKLGFKYTKSMRVKYLDEGGKERTPVMGCYGIGVDRALASIIEEHNDGDGVIWPMSVAPFHCVVVPIKYEGAMREVADGIHDGLRARGVEVLLDDRNERPGVKFKDADLMGIPLRVVVGDKNLPANVELKVRDAAAPELVPAEGIVAEVKRRVDAALESLES